MHNSDDDILKMINGVVNIQSDEKNRALLNRTYDKIANGGVIDVEVMKKARAEILNKLKLSSDWPINHDGKKVGYQKGKDKGSKACILYNRLCALICHDIECFKNKYLYNKIEINICGHTHVVSIKEANSIINNIKIELDRFNSLN